LGLTSTLRHQVMNEEDLGSSRVLSSKVELPICFVISVNQVVMSLYHFLCLLEYSYMQVQHPAKAMQKPACLGLV